MSDGVRQESLSNLMYFLSLDSAKITVTSRRWLDFQ